MEKKIGDKVEAGETLAYIHTNKEDKIENAKRDLKKAYKISKESSNEYRHILGIV